MTADSQWPLQKAIYTALRADSSLRTLISNPVRVFDHVPQKTAFPYILIGEAATEDWDTVTTDGMDITITIHTWSRYRGMKETKQIMEAILNVLDKSSLTVTGHNLILFLFEFSDTFMDADGFTRHGVQRFRALTSDT